MNVCTTPQWQVSSDQDILATEMTEWTPLIHHDHLIFDTKNSSICVYNTYTVSIIQGR